MNGIRLEDFVRYFEKAADIQFIDSATGKPVLELILEQSGKPSPVKSGYEQWLDEQDEATRLEHQMGAI